MTNHKALERLKKSISEKKVLSFTYDGYERQVEVHTFGISRFLGSPSWVCQR